MDGACICSAGGCSCCLMEHPEFKPVGRTEAEERSIFFLNEAHQMAPITKYQLRKQRERLRAFNKKQNNKNAVAFRSAFTDEQWIEEHAVLRARVERALRKK